MVGGHEQAIAGPEKLEYGGQCRVHRGEPGREALHVVAVAPGHVEVHQVREDESFAAAPQQVDYHRQVLVVRGHLDLFADTSAGEDLIDLADSGDLHPTLGQQIEIGRARGGEREILAIGGARERPRRAGERARYDARDRMGAAQDLAGDRTIAVELLQRHHLDVAGDLEHAVRRRVDDGPPGDHVLPAKLRDDLGARGGFVAQHIAPDPPAERTQHLFGETIGIHREGPGGDHPHVLPVAVGGVLTGGELGQPARQGEGARDRRDSPQGVQIPQAE